MFLKQRLEAWRAAGIIDAAQVERIFEHESNSRASARWLIWCVAAIGGLAIVAGLISVIAANWDEIPDALKLAVAVGTLAALPIAAWRLGDRADGWPRDLVLFIHQLLVLAVIGLVGQVFHLHGAAWRPLALTSALAIPVAIAATRALHINVVIGFVLATIATSLDALDWWEPLWRHGMPGFAVASTLGALFYCGSALTGSQWPRLAGPLRLWGLGLAFFGIIAQAIRWTFDVGSPGREQTIGLVALAIGVVALLATFRTYTPARIVGLLSAVALLLGPEFLFAESSFATKIIAFVLAVLFCLAWAFVAADLGRRRQVNLATLLLGLRIVVAFADLFESLMDTGIGLLLTGVVLIAVSYGWWRLRGAIPVVKRAQ